MRASADSPFSRALPKKENRGRYRARVRQGDGKMQKQDAEREYCNPPRGDRGLGTRLSPRAPAFSTLLPEKIRQASVQMPGHVCARGGVEEEERCPARRSTRDDVYAVSIATSAPRLPLPRMTAGNSYAFFGRAKRFAFHFGRAKIPPLSEALPGGQNE